MIFWVYLVPWLLTGRGVESSRSGRSRALSGACYCPVTISVDFVLGKTGNRIAVALAREAVAAARL